MNQLLRHTFRYHFLAIILLAGLAGCAPLATTPAPVNSPGGATADVVVTLGGLSQKSVLRVGQIIGVLSPDTSSEWQVTYNPSHLTALTPPEQMQQPGPSGWRFRVIAPGDLQLTFTQIVSARCGTPPCPSVMPQQFILNFQVSPQ